MKKRGLSERAITLLFIWTGLLLLWLVPHIAVTGRLPDFRVYFSAAFMISTLPLLCWMAVSNYELKKRKARALPYLIAYMVAACFYAVFFAFAIGPPGLQGKLHRFVWYLLFTTSVLVLGIVLHRRAVVGLRRLRTAGSQNDDEP